ncbi:MAG: peptidoglycan editing factor PgeF [Methylocystaceae bacterium]
MLYRQAQGLTWLYSPTWEEQGVTVAFSTRAGGASGVPFKGLNLGLHVGDDQDQVRLNRQHWLQAMTINEQPCCAQQIHGTQVAVVTGEDAGQGYLNYRDSLPGVDGMVTNTSQLPLFTAYADCIPVFLFDPQQRVIGLLHSGWQGTAGRISQRAVELMSLTYGSRPQDIQAIIGPGIGPCCYQVDTRVATIFRKEFAEHRQLLYPKNQDSYWYLDLKRAVQQTLIASGLDANAIEDASICTCCRRDLFYSHRGEQGKCGRMGALIELR